MTALTFLLTACGTLVVEAPPLAASQAPPARSESPFAPQRAADLPADPIRPARNGATSVALTALHTEQDLELSGHRAEVERNAGPLQRCWEARAAKLPVREGAVILHAQIDPAGAVTEQCLTEDPFHDPGLQRCVNDLIAMGRYPAGAPADISFTLQFSAPKG